MDRIILFVALSIPVILISWRTLFSLKTHGFYRFLSWECIIWLFASNYRYWFQDPFSALQVFSWIFLCASGYLVIIGAIVLKRKGKPVQSRKDKSLYQFEQTSQLVETGIYKHIRHPLYASLLFLSWGICLKHIVPLSLGVAVASTLFLYVTALFDEKECIRVFGQEYREYMKRSKRFIPFLL